MPRIFDNIDERLLPALQETIRSKTRGEVSSQLYVGSRSKPIIDEIDRALAKHYGFTDEELDFIINYDIKYRMGGADSADAEED